MKLRAVCYVLNQIDKGPIYLLNQVDKGPITIESGNKPLYNLRFVFAMF